MDVVEVLSFLFMLSTMELGRVRDGPTLLQCPCHPPLNLGIFDREFESNTESNA
jgi:hypothetical protein